MPGWAFMILASALFSAMTVMARVSTAHVSWAQAAFGRALVGTGIALLALRASGHRVSLLNSRASWGRSLFGAGGMTCTFFAISQTQLAVGDVTTLRSTGPLFVALMAPLVIGERPAAREKLGVVIGFMGVLVLVGPRFNATFGVASVALLSSVFTAAAMLFLRKVGTREPSDLVAFHFGIVTTFVTGLFALPSWQPIGVKELGMILATGALGGLGQLALTRAYAREQATRLAILSYLGIVMTQGLGYLVLDELPTLSQILGCSLVISAGVVVAVPTVSPSSDEAR